MCYGVNLSNDNKGDCYNNGKCGIKLRTFLDKWRLNEIICGNE